MPKICDISSTYVELRCKTHYSFLRGASRPEEIVEQAVHLGLQGIGITDVNGVYGMPKAYAAARKYPQLKFLVGAELTFKEHPNLTFIATNKNAYGFLCRMLTQSHAGKEKGLAHLTWNELCDFSLDSRSKDLILIPSSHQDTRWKELAQMFKGRIYIPIEKNFYGRDKDEQKRLLEIAQSIKAPIVASSDVHYHHIDRWRLQQVLSCIRENTNLQKAGYKVFANSQRYLRSPEEMKKLYEDIPEALGNTLKIAGACTFCPSELRYRYPSEWLPSQHTAQSYLEELSLKGARERYPKGIPDKILSTLYKELELVERLKFADYFLTVYDVVSYAKEKNILCQGRGAAANSAVCYCLGITAVDPNQMELLFERFISEERGEPPDIDVDFEHERREEVIQYIYQKYGRDRAAMVSAVVTYRGRSALIDTTKAFGVDIGTISARALEKNFDEIVKNSTLPEIKNQILAMAEELKGCPRHLSIHSGGFTLSADPIIEIVPVEPARMEGRTIIQWDKYDLDILGLLKVDLLALGMLTAIQKMLKMVGKELYQIEHDDQPTYQMIQKAETIGTFQIESRAQMGMLGRLLPKNFYDLVVQVAIVRPGPIQGKMVHPYLRRRRGLEPVEYPHPKLKSILGRTFGVPLFQEQVMKMAIDLAGFTPGEADELRRAIGAWRSSGSIQKMGAKLVNGLKKSGLSAEFAERVYDQIKGFAEYGFPESHAASFALIAYVSCYLKCHHPVEFTCGLINSQPLGFYANHTLVDDLKRQGKSVLPVDPHTSLWDCTVENGELRLGWRVVHGISKTEVEELIAVRNEKNFDSLQDFLKRTRFNPRVLHKMAMGDIFKCFGHDQREALWIILFYQMSRQNYRQNYDKNSDQQLPLFELQNYSFTKNIEFEEIEAMDAVKEDYKSFSLSVRGHPMQFLRAKGIGVSYTLDQVKKNKDRSQIVASGMLIVRQRPQTSKGVVFGTLEDESGFLDLIFQNKIYERYRDVINFNSFLTIKGQIQKDTNSCSVVVNKITALLPDHSSAPPIQSHDYH